ncbi:helix-turn-helix transcriptional regulator [Desulfosediminicola ganghwensis]|uniref:helix-turn-helix transcriptional regulator n=1 Tax=Desulfosediminicola ganghwensis TaxID=2569540 RepID=UPI0010AD81C5|nr:AlpA family transcriptional regulator [Desulfosediminicola ganghwensis]
MKTKLLRLPEVESITGLKKSAIYAWVKKGFFPPPVRLGAKAVAWRASDVQEWVDKLPRRNP